MAGMQAAGCLGGGIEPDAPPCLVGTGRMNGLVSALDGATPGRPGFRVGHGGG